MLLNAIAYASYVGYLVLISKAAHYRKLNNSYCVILEPNFVRLSLVLEYLKLQLNLGSTCSIRPGLLHLEIQNCAMRNSQLFFLFATYAAHKLTFWF